MNSIIEEIKVLSASDNIIKNGSFETLAAPAELATTVDFSNWTYDSGSITAFSDAGGGEVNCVDVGHGLLTNDLHEIRNCSTDNGNGYDGAYVITKVDNDNYKITHAWDGTETADWVKICTRPLNWDSDTMTVGHYIVEDSGGGLKLVSDSDTFDFEEVEIFLDITEDSSVNYRIVISSINANSGVSLVCGATTIATFEEIGTFTGIFDAESADIKLVSYTATTELVIESLSLISAQLFEDWDSFNDGSATIEEDIGYVGNRSAKFNMTELETFSYVVQSISGGDITDILGKTVVLGFAYKSNGAQVGVSYNLDDDDWQNPLLLISNEDWNYGFINIFVPPGSTSLNIRIGLFLDSLSIHHSVFDDVKLYYINEELLEKEIIVDKDNIMVMIEDDLFTFTSNDISMKLRNEANDGYMNPMNFITEDKLYSIIIKYNSGTDSVPSYQYQYLFTNWDNCSREQSNDSDYIFLSFFELSGLLSDMNWYIGRYIYDLDVSESGIYRFSTDVPLILDKNSPLAPTPAPEEDILNDRLLPALQSVIVQNKLPVYPNNINIEIEENLLSDFSWVTNFNTIDGDELGKSRILDYFIDKYTRRIFVLLVSNEWTYSSSTVRSIDLYEIINGTVLSHVYTIESENDMDDYLQIGFVHRWDNNIFYGSSGNEFTILITQIYHEAESDYRIKNWNFKYNVDGNVEYVSSGSQTFNAYPLFRESDYVTSVGGFGELGGINNYLFINSYQTSNSYPEYDDVIKDSLYTFSNVDISTSGNREFGWANNLSLSTYKFPRYLHLINEAGFTDSTLANIMKELCVTQDALWYFKYTSSHGITLYIRRRSLISGEGVTAIDDVSVNSDVKTIGTQLSIITFDDISSSIYANDPYRVKVFREWYNAKYGGGKQIKPLTMWNIQNLVLGEVRPLLSEEGKYFMLKYLEWDRKNSETFVDIFEIIEDV